MKQYFSLKPTLILLAIFLTNSVQAATITPNTPDDLAFRNDGMCTLREAIDNANDDAATHSDCPAGSGSDVIDLKAGQTYDLRIIGDFEDGNATGDLDIADDLEISVTAFGGKTTATISGGGDRVLHVEGPDTVTLKYLIIKNGVVDGGSNSECGGGIRAENAALNLINVTVSGNTLAGVGSSGAGICISGGILSLSHSTISNNTLTGASLASLSYSYGGGIGANGSAVSLNNSTVAGNTVIDDRYAGGGGIAAIFDSTLELNNSTISGNIVSNSVSTGATGGGILSSSDDTVSIKNTILSGNRAIGRGSSGEDCDGTLQSYGYNFIAATTSNCIANEAANSGTDKTTQVHSTLNLSPLANNGGPNKTMALGSGSLAIDTGNCFMINSGITKDDQRGSARDAHCDIGAYEYVPLVKTPQIEVPVTGPL